MPGLKNFRLAAILFAAVFILTALLSFLTSPLFISLESDVVYQDSLLVPALYYFNQIADELRVSALICLSAVAMYVFHKKTTFKVLSVVLIFECSFFRYAFNVFSTGLSDGFDRLDRDDYLSSLFSFGIEALIFLITLLISAAYTKKHFETAPVKEKASIYLGNPVYDERLDVYPYRKFISPKAMVAGPIFWGCLIAFAEKLLDTVIYDIDLGLPEDIEEVADMVQMYLGLIVLLAISYTFAYFLSTLFLKKKD